MFEVTEHGCLAYAGAIAVGLELPGYKGIKEVWLPDGFVGVQLLDGINYNADSSRQPHHEWRGGAIDAEILRPLTPTARDMLALVKR